MFEPVTGRIVTVEIWGSKRAVGRIVENFGEAAGTFGVTGLDDSIQRIKKVRSLQPYGRTLIELFGQCLIDGDD